MIASAYRHTMTTPTDRTIRVEREFDAPRERVWRAFTEPDLIAQWWGRGNKLVIERWESKRGGHWRVVEHSKDGVHGFEGRFREVTPPRTNSAHVRMGRDARIPDCRDRCVRGSR